MKMNITELEQQRDALIKQINELKEKEKQKAEILKKGFQNSILQVRKLQKEIQHIEEVWGEVLSNITDKKDMEIHFLNKEECRVWSYSESKKLEDGKHYHLYFLTDDGRFEETTMSEEDTDKICEFLKDEYGKEYGDL